MSSDLPIEFVNRVLQDDFLGSEIVEVLDTASPISLRTNKHKVAPLFEEKAKVAWCENGIYLSERPSYVRDPLFHSGAYYPQEAGSMLLDAMLKQIPLPDNPKILDLCAAPGGKSTLIASHLDGKGLLLANEFVLNRAKILQENMSKWGYHNVAVSSNAAADFKRLPHFFDVLVVDAPCSGEGMFRKDHASRDEWSSANVFACAARQQTILSDVWETLAPGGWLIYSTCTFNAHENEEIVDWMMKEYDASIEEFTIPTGIQKGRGGIGYYCIPGKVKSEGFFIAVLRKKNDEKSHKIVQRKKGLVELKPTKEINEYVRLDGIKLFGWKEKVLAVPERIFEDMLLFQAHLYLLKMGTWVGELHPKGFIPSEELALNPSILKWQQRIEVSLDQALSYLRGETFSLPANAGYKLLTYREEPLGWIKHLGNRFNNCYPKNWRIRIRL